jgi:hypothetical protein
MISLRLRRPDGFQPRNQTLNLSSVQSRVGFPGHLDLWHYL